MTTCELCEQIAQGKDVLGQTDDIAILLAQEPASEGHLLVVPKQHAAIAEQVPNNVISDMFTTANALSSQLFSQLGFQGTNLLLQNGLAAGQSINHVTLNIIPRKEGDGLNLEWQPKQLSDEEMSQLETTIKAEGSQIGQFEKPEHKIPKQGSEETKDKEKPDSDTTEVDYMIEQLKRIP